MSRPAIIYISGPISGLKKEEYMANFKAADKKLKAAGYWTFNPAEANDKMPPWFKHEDFMEICHAEMILCDMVCMLDDWEHSNGACTEKFWAEQEKKHIFTVHEI